MSLRGDYDDDDRAADRLIFWSVVGVVVYLILSALPWWYAAPEIFGPVRPGAGGVR